MQADLAKTNQSAVISTGCKKNKTGTSFAVLRKQLFGMCALLMFVLAVASSCVIPADIRERPDGDIDAEYDYWPNIVNPQPPAGVYSINPECIRLEFFQFILADDLPAEDTERQENFETRWYNGDELVGKFEGFTIKPQFSISTRDLYEDSEELANGYREYILRAYVSDLGFADETNPILEEGAHSSQVIWIVRFDTDIPCP